uniref:Protein kinase domain-containing protein n=1 Tax=Cyclopterus lumpus TaxID=8103 RepID=A0A8C3APP8_CYCLU
SPYVKPSTCGDWDVPWHSYFLARTSSLANQHTTRRITPGQALRHDFITMCHMTDNMDTSSYVQAAYELMNVSPPYDLDEYENTLSSEQDVFSRDEDKDAKWDNCDPSSPNEPFQLKQEEIISNKSTQYLVLDFIGEGCFGKVAKCLNLKTDKTTAIKIFKDIKEHKEEVKMLEQLRALDPEKNNLLEYIDSFIIQDVPYVTFEMLDTSLWDFVLQRRAPLTPKEIRPIARQLLVAFEALKSIGLIHTDLKPDNVMFVNHKDEPFKVKLIDFGLAMPASEVKTGMIMQPCGYRAPEVNLGLPICEAIDMWGLGCTLAFLFFGQGIFSGKSTYNSWCFDTVGTLEEAVKSCSNPTDFIEREDTMAFSNLLKWLLCPDAKRRITPEQALRHDFITMCHMTNTMDTSSYLKKVENG